MHKISILTDSMFQFSNNQTKHRPIIPVNWWQLCNTLGFVQYNTWQYYLSVCFISLWSLFFNKWNEVSRKIFILIFFFFMYNILKLILFLDVKNHFYFINYRVITSTTLTKNKQGQVTLTCMSLSLISFSVKLNNLPIFSCPFCFCVAVVGSVK